MDNNNLFQSFYSFLIGGDGTVYEGRGWHIDSTKQDYRYIDYYSKSIDIALIGNYESQYIILRLDIITANPHFNYI